jgi:predicted neuraminidase
MHKAISLCLIGTIITASLVARGQLEKASTVREMLIFPLQSKHTHACSIVNLPNGDLLACWYYGSGEREADDVKIMGARLKQGAAAWSDTFLMADSPGLPDCNPILFLNNQNKLFLIWIAVVGNRWEYSILRVRTSSQYAGQGAPAWDWQDDLLLKPDDRFSKEITSKFKELEQTDPASNGTLRGYDSTIIQASRDPGKRSIGWMTRIKPLLQEHGRILLPLYSDGFNLSLIAISDDDGATWHASLPIVGRENVQPALVQAKNGHIVAYMRDNGPAPSRVQRSESTDNGVSWTAARKTNIPNTASVELKILRDGRWVFVGNDIDDGRYRLSLYISDDEGQSWKWKKTLENVPKGKGSFSYPCVLQTEDGLLHITYSFSPGRNEESIKYVEIDPGTLK